MTEAEENPEIDQAHRKDLAQHGYVTRWVSIAEVMGEDGEKRLVLSRGPSNSAIPDWDVRGMMYEILKWQGLFEEDD